MKKTIERLWNEYLADDCAEMKSEEEREATKTALELHDTVNRLLNDEQREWVKKYVDAIYELNTHFTRKAFEKGCKFTASFLFEATNNS